jgi:hypothetical protein
MMQIKIFFSARYIFGYLHMANKLLTQGQLTIINLFSVKKGAKYMFTDEVKIHAN